MIDFCYIISHIPKTAGSSLRVHFENHLNDQTEFIHLANRGHKKAGRKSLQPYYDRDQNSRNLAKVIFGHQVNSQTKQLITDKNVREVVVFRNPLDWEISRFNQYANAINRDHSIPLSFADWCNQNKVKKLHSQFDWFLEKYLSSTVSSLPISQRNELLFATLKSFKHILFVEDFLCCGPYP